MDGSLRERERQARCAPADRDEVLAHARMLARAGRIADAAALLRARIAARYIDTETLTALVEMTAGRGLLKRSPGSSEPRTHVDLVVRGSVARTDGLAELAPTIAFIGAPQAESWRPTRRLLRSFLGQPPDPRSCERVRSTVAFDEPALDFRVPLRAPWHVAPGYSIHSIRILNLPGSARAAKLRLRLLRSVSALAFVLDHRFSAASHRGTFCELARDFRRMRGHGLDRFPLLVLHTSPESLERHEELTRTLDAGPLDGVVLEDGVDCAAESLATLLLGVARGVQGLVRPRPRG